MLSGHGKGIDQSFRVVDSKLQGHGCDYDRGKIQAFYTWLILPKSRSGRLIEIIIIIRKKTVSVGTFPT